MAAGELTSSLDRLLAGGKAELLTSFLSAYSDLPGPQDNLSLAVKTSGLIAILSDGE